MNKIIISKEKLEHLKKQLKDKESNLKDMKDEQVKKGGLSDSWHETAAFEATSAASEENVKRLRYIISSAKLLPEKVFSDKVVIGSWVRLKDDNGIILEYRLVHPIEADPTKNLLSIESPIGKELLGKKAQESVEVNGKKYGVISIS